MEGGDTADGSGCLQHVRRVLRNKDSGKGAEERIGINDGLRAKKRAQTSPFFVRTYLLIICQPVEPELVQELQQVSQVPEQEPVPEQELQQASGPPLSSGIQ
jgi:hypothetical protein